jgi:hypothetical protein
MTTISMSVPALPFVEAGMFIETCVSGAAQATPGTSHVNAEETSSALARTTERRRKDAAVLHVIMKKAPQRL